MFQPEKTRNLVLPSLNRQPFAGISVYAYAVKLPPLWKRDKSPSVSYSPWSGEILLGQPCVRTRTRVCSGEPCCNFFAIKTSLRAPPCAKAPTPPRTKQSYPSASTPRRHIRRRSRSCLSHGLTRLSQSPSIKKTPLGSGARYHENTRNLPACLRHHI